MSDKEWEDAYHACWKSYYSSEHIETVTRRHAALPEGTSGKNPFKAAKYLTEFRALYHAEDVHPLEGGMLRLKFRTDRRPGRPLELPGLFHLKLAGQLARKLWIYGRFVYDLWRIVRKVNNDPKRLEYTDLAIAPVSADDFENLAMFHDTAGGEAAVAKKRGEDVARERVAKARAIAAE